jgi:hypothetical protein
MILSGDWESSGTYQPTCSGGERTVFSGDSKLWNHGPIFGGDVHLRIPNHFCN